MGMTTSILPNFLLGEMSVEGSPYSISQNGHELRCFSVTESQLRAIKRGLWRAMEILREIPTDVIYKVLKALPQYYYSDPEAREELIRYSGRARHDIAYSLR